MKIDTSRKMDSLKNIYRRETEVNFTSGREVEGWGHKKKKIERSSILSKSMIRREYDITSSAYIFLSRLCLFFFLHLFVFCTHELIFIRFLHRPYSIIHWSSYIFFQIRGATSDRWSSLIIDRLAYSSSDNLIIWRYAFEFRLIRNF